MIRIVTLSVHNVHYNGTFLLCYILGPCAKFRKMTISFVMSVRLSAWNNSPPPPLEGFSSNAISEYFSGNCREFLLKSDKNIAKITRKPIYIFFIARRSILLRMRNVSDQSCRENKNTHLIVE